MLPCVRWACPSWREIEWHRGEGPRWGALRGIPDFDCRTARSQGLCMGTERNATRETYELSIGRLSSQRGILGGQLKPCLISVNACAAPMAATQRANQARDQIDVATVNSRCRHWGPHARTQISLRPLVHELVHHWQRHSASSETGYHKPQFARKMFEIGLVTSDYRQPGGRRLDRG